MQSAGKQDTNDQVTSGWICKDWDDLVEYDDESFKQL